MYAKLHVRSVQLSSEIYVPEFILVPSRGVCVALVSMCVAGNVREPTTPARGRDSVVSTENSQT